MIEVQRDLATVLDQVDCTPRTGQQLMDHNEVHGLMWNLLILKIPEWGCSCLITSDSAKSSIIAF
jgi:hypothetical protein